MIAFFAGLLLVAVMVIGSISGNNEKLKIENREMKNKISELKRTLKYREYSFISYKGFPLKVVKICNIFNDGTTIKSVPVILNVSTNTESGRMLFNESVKKPDTYFEILIGNKIRAFYAAECSIEFLILIEIIDTDKGDKENETQNN